MRLDKVSNHRITQKELDFWRERELDIGNRIPKRDDILAAYVVFELCSSEHENTTHSYHKKTTGKNNARIFKLDCDENSKNRYKKIVDTVEGHVYTDQEVNEMVRLRKERNKNEILNYGIEILQIQESLQLALEQQTQNEDDVELNQKIDGLRQRLKELEQQEKEREETRVKTLPSKRCTSLTRNT